MFLAWVRFDIDIVAEGHGACYLGYVKELKADVFVQQNFLNLLSKPHNKLV